MVIEVMFYRFLIFFIIMFFMDFYNFVDTESIIPNKTLKSFVKMLKNINLNARMALLEKFLYIANLKILKYCR